MKSRKRIVSMLLACCLLITLFPTIGFASEITSQAADGERTAEDAPYENSAVDPVYAIRDEALEPSTTALTTRTSSSFAGGDGTAENPYQISTAEQLDGIRNNLSAHYILLNDINLSAFDSWIPIGTSETPFRGSLDGDNYRIIGLKINNGSVAEWLKFHSVRPTSAMAGLFGRAGSGAQFRNIHLTECIIDITDSGTNQLYCGGLCGYSSATITGCSTSGTFSAFSASSVATYAGGVTGKNENGGGIFDTTISGGYS